MTSSTNNSLISDLFPALYDAPDSWKFLAGNYNFNEAPSTNSSDSISETPVFTSPIDRFSLEALKDRFDSLSKDMDLTKPASSGEVIEEASKKQPLDLVPTPAPQPKRTVHYWTREQDVFLIKSVRKNTRSGTVKWKLVEEDYKSLGKNLSMNTLINRFIHLNSEKQCTRKKKQPAPRHIWTAEEDELLMAALPKSDKDNKISWTLVAARLRSQGINVSNKQVSGHYNDRLKFIARPWTVEESRQLVHFIVENGRRWSRFGKEHQRSGSDVRNHTSQVQFKKIWKEFEKNAGAL